MSILRAILLTGTLLIPHGAVAQTYPFLNFSIEQGLSESVAYDLLEDREGRLWIATGFGLNRYDGFQFKTFHTSDGLSGNKIYDIHQTRDGDIWIGLDSGVDRLRRDKIVDDPRTSPLRGSRVISMLEDRDGVMWFGTDGQGLWRLPRDGSEATPFVPSERMAASHVTSMAQSPDGSIWFGTREGLHRLTREGSFRTIQLAAGAGANRIQDLLPAGNRAVSDDAASPGAGPVDLWVGTFDGLFLLRDGVVARRFGTLDGLTDRRIQALASGSGGDLWIGTESGLARFADGRFQTFSTREGLANPVIYSLLADREGDIWVGTFGSGIYQFPGDHFTNLTTEDGLPNPMVTSFTRGLDGSLWISTYGGGVLQISPDGSRRVFTQDQRLLDNKVYTLHADAAGDIWIGTQWGINLHDRSRNTLSAIPSADFPFPKVRDFMEDAPSGGMWVATYEDGLILLAPDGSGRHRIRKHFTTSNGLASNVVMSLGRDSTGALWAATYGGISILDPDTDAIRTLSLEEGLPSQAVIHVFQDAGGEMWASTFLGAARYRDGRFQSFHVDREGDEMIAYFVFQDEIGGHWMGTNIGLVGIDADAYVDAQTLLDRHRAMRRLTRRNGLIANELNAGAVYAEADGSFWLGTVSGASLFAPGRLASISNRPGITLQEVILAGESILDTGASTFSYDRNRVKVDFKGISLSSPDQILYRHRLVGLEDGWTETYARSVEYPALPPGDYEFQVQAVNSEGLISESVAGIAFRIQPPYWRRWWFLLLVAGLAAGVILFVLHYLRVRKLIEMERIRVQIASDLHDDVGASLTELALQSDMLLATTAPDDALGETLRQIGEQSRRIVGSLDDIVWSIDARNDTAGDLTDRIQDYAATVFRHRDISVGYHFSNLDMSHRLPVQTKENLYLIAKEAINNIHKHSEATRVEITLDMTRSDFRLIIADNGPAAANGRRSGQGQRNMRMRADRLGADLRITQNGGCTVEVEGPLRGSPRLNNPSQRDPASS